MRILLLFTVLVAIVHGFTPGRGSCVSKNMGSGLASKYFSNGEVQTVYGLVGQKGAIYMTCKNGKLICHEEDGILDKTEEPLVNCQKASAKRRLGLTLDPAKIKLWPEGVLCYKVETEFKPKIQKLMKEGNAHLESSGIRVLSIDECKKADDKDKICGGCTDYLAIRNDKKGCFAAVGYQANGGQSFNVEDGCFKVGFGRYVHEMLHSLGIYHEHAHPNKTSIILRDELKVAENNYLPKTEAVYTKYDFVSLMHYSSNAGVCIPKKKYGDVKFCTIDKDELDGCVIPKRKHCDKKESKKLGQRKALSKQDVNTIKALYGCKDTGKEATIHKLRAEQVKAKKKTTKSSKKKTKKHKKKKTKTKKAKKKSEDD
ncbi:metalloprotease family M12A [Thraustotheca clavata]|uniref:Metalloendopeptidase n=1 Tax=Thraustotheca clavata TaxID=74557 RepID=A0A0A7CMH8_9STRA|nr:secreted protein [Thraustotheca clavata]OQR95579.1 metalloprotease family M12A [Thraustotheca clavata]